MKKIKIISVLLACILTVSLCGTFTVLASDMKPMPSGSPSVTPSTAPVGAIDVAAAYRKWKQYVTFGEEEPVSPGFTTKEEFLRGSQTSEITVDTSYQGQGFVIVSIQTEIKDDNDALLECRTLITCYNAETMAVIKDYTQVIVEENGIVHASRNKGQQVEFNVEAQNGVLFVERKTYEAISETNPVQYLPVVKYAVFLKNGTQLGNGWLTAKPTWNEPENASQYKELTVENTVYVLKSGEVIKTFPKGLEHDIPCYENANGVWFTQGNYTYFINELPFQEIGVSGDFRLVVFPGIKLQVMDNNFNVVANYESTGDSVVGYGVLSNGNVVISEIDYVHKDATDFDFIANDLKVKVKNSIIDVTSGARTALSSNFILHNVFTNATASISTKMQENTMFLATGHVHVEEEYFLAQMQKVENGKLSYDKVFVVMNNDGTLKTELPEIASNQFGYMGYFNKETPIIATTSVGNLMRFYKITTTNKLSLFFNMDNESVKNIQHVTDKLIIYKNAIYTVNGKFVEDLSDYANYEVCEDTIVAYTNNASSAVIFTENTDSTYSNVNKKYIYAGYNEKVRYNAEGKFFTVVNTRNSNNVIAVYDKYGNKLIEDTVLHYNLSQDVQVGENIISVPYKKEREIVQCYVFGEKVVVHCQEICTITDSSYNMYWAVMPKTVDVYYVLK